MGLTPQKHVQVLDQVAERAKRDLLDLVVKGRGFMKSKEICGPAKGWAFLGGGRRWEIRERFYKTRDGVARCVFVYGPIRLFRKRREYLIHQSVVKLEDVR